MDWKILGTTFVAVFIAELGDKTQLATLSFASSSPSRLPVFFGSAAALICTSALAVFGGEALSKLISPRLLQRGAGFLFLIIGAWVLWGAFSSPGQPAAN
jgi:putative Ca2+/H+ antiporter (TMEM165/GDT1 family)